VSRYWNRCDRCQTPRRSDGSGALLVFGWSDGAGELDRAGADMKRSATLKRKTPLLAKGWRLGSVKNAEKRQWRRRSKYKQRERDFDYMGCVRRLPCIVSVIERSLPHCEYAALPFKFMRVTLCGGHVQADHMGKRGLGQKADDRTCAPMCEHHHAERTDYRGVFYGFRGMTMRVFCNWAIEWTQKQVKEMS
jgi:hypothetical protein